MAGISLKVDYNELARIFESNIETDARIKNMVNNFVTQIFKRNKDILLKEFNNHKITVELKGGSSASNLSGTLDGNGNLFSFLGFFHSKNPTAELEELLNLLTIRKTTRKGNILYYSINLPTKREIESATRMDWGTGTSWAFAVETGNFNGDAALSHFIFKTWINSRSQQGIQVKNKYSESKFSPTPYISEILENFQKRINNATV
jgi:hypothetical protein